MEHTILVVDDEVDNLQLLVRTFRKNFKVLKALSAIEGIEILKNNHVDAVISDHKMPVMDGVEFLKHVYEKYPAALRILLTAYSDSEILISAINQGKIYRYVKKPFIVEDILSIVNAGLEQNKIENENTKLVADFKDLFTGTINAITEALDSKDSYTSGRSKRVATIALKIAQKLGLSDTELSKIELAGMLHDIGMIGVPEHILNKPERLTDEEYQIVKMHVEQGVKILEDIKQLDSVIDIIKYHHERFDGVGYPYALKGDEIPLGAKIISIADTFDSIISERAYRQPLNELEAIEIIKQASGSQFDPLLVEAFCDIIDTTLKELET